MIIYNSILPFKGFKAIAIFPFIFIRKKYKGEDLTLTLYHEKIHFRQQLEHLLILFYLVYFIEWLFKGYDFISFEKEAYLHQDNKNYLKSRRIFANYKYL